MATSTQSTSTTKRPEDEKTQREREIWEQELQIKEIQNTRQAAFLEEEKTLFTWQAPSRVYKPRSREYFSTIGTIVLLVCVILFFFQEFFLMIVVGALAFVAYVLATVKPEEVTHEISSRGVRTGNQFYRWDELGRFWFEDTSGQMVVTIETFRTFPRTLIMIIDPNDKEKMKRLLSPYVLLEKPEPGFLDNATTWMSEKIPLES